MNVLPDKTSDKKSNAETNRPNIQDKKTWLEYVRKGLQRSINTAKNPLIKEIYEAELRRLDGWIRELE